MKTAEEIKKGLGMCGVIRGRCKGCPYDGEVECVSKHSADALAYIQQLEDQIRDIPKMVPKWISAEERLPDDDVNVLVYAIGNNENDVIAMTSYTHNMLCYGIEGWRSPWQYFFAEYKITHWMPLPEPPKEG